MHIPDGFLSTPVWVALDGAAIPAVAFAVRRAQHGFDQSRIPLLGVMGAFVFAAQMINFPVGPGTSGHLVGGALLACTLGPAAAAVTMTAILAIQALVFQDGGVLALGANVLNMAVFGVLAGYLPFWLWGGARGRRVAVFAGGVLSVLVSAVLALAELLSSGIRMTGPVLGISLGLFLVSAILEGAITVAVVGALETMQPELIRKPRLRAPRALAALGGAAMLLAVVGVLFASTAPDGLEKLARDAGFASRATAFLSSPFADYEVGFGAYPWIRKAAAGFAGLVLIWAACFTFGRIAARKRSRA